MIAALGIVAAAAGGERRIMLLTWMIDRLALRRFSPKVLTAARQHIYHLESNVYDFYKHHPKALFRQ